MNKAPQHMVDDAFLNPDEFDAQRAHDLWGRIALDPDAQTRWNTLAQAEGLLWDKAAPLEGSAAQIGRMAFLGALDEQLDQEAEQDTTPATQSATIIEFPLKRVLSMAAMLCIVGVGAVLASRMIAQPSDQFQPRTGIIAPADHPGVQVFCAQSDEQSASKWSIHSAQDEPYGVLTCPLDGKLMVRMARPAPKDGWMAIFGVSDTGQVHWISPSPVHPEPVRVLHAEQRRIGAPIDLSVNHQTGTLRMHAIFSEQPVTYDALTKWIDEARSGSSISGAQRLHLGPHHTISAPYQVLEVAP